MDGSPMPKQTTDWFKVAAITFTILVALISTVVAGATGYAKLRGDVETNTLAITTAKDDAKDDIADTQEDIQDIKAVVSSIDVSLRKLEVTLGKLTTAMELQHQPGGD